MNLIEMFDYTSKENKQILFECLEIKLSVCVAIIKSYTTCLISISLMTIFFVVAIENQ